MGNDLDERVITIRTSAHNSPQDDHDRNLREAFLYDLEKLMSRYREVGLDVYYGMMR